jgi:hypothetical protein
MRNTLLAALLSAGLLAGTRFPLWLQRPKARP